MNVLNEELIEQMVTPKNMSVAWRAFVVRNNGPGGALPKRGTRGMHEALIYGFDRPLRICEAQPAFATTFPKKKIDI